MIVYPINNREARVLRVCGVLVVGALAAVLLLLFSTGCCTLCLRRVFDDVRRHTERPPVPYYVAEAK